MVAQELTRNEGQGIRARGQCLPFLQSFTSTKRYNLGPAICNRFLEHAVVIDIIQVEFIPTKQRLLIFRLSWQQNMYVVVMLTREVDGATVKYAPYWTMDPSAAGSSPYKFQVTGSRLRPLPRMVPYKNSRASTHTRRDDRVVFEPRYMGYPNLA